jgi:branched-chain amino acid transport system permease protein
MVVAMPFWLPEYYLGIATRALVFVGLALAWNIVGGMGGQFSLAHSLFVAAGAHLAGALYLHYGLNLWIGMLASALTSALLGALIAWLAFRFRLPHLSFALITLAFGEIGLLVVLGTEFLGAASGLFLPPRPPNTDILNFQFATSSAYHWVMLSFALLAFAANVRVLGSKLGYYLRAIRGNEDAAQAIGVDLLRYKVSAMALSAVLTSLIGTAYSQYLLFVDPYLFASPIIVVEIVLFATIGGLGTLWGPVLGAGLLVPVGEILRGQLGGILPGLHFFIFGSLIVAVILFMPNGLVGGLQSLRKRLRTAPDDDKVVLERAAG